MIIFKLTSQWMFKDLNKLKMYFNCLRQEYIDHFYGFFFKRSGFFFLMQQIFIFCFCHRLLLVSLLKVVSSKEWFRDPGCCKLPPLSEKRGIHIHKGQRERKLLDFFQTQDVWKKQVWKQLKSFLDTSHWP